MRPRSLTDHRVLLKSLKIYLVLSFRARGINRDAINWPGHPWLSEIKNKKLQSKWENLQHVQIVLNKHELSDPLRFINIIREEETVLHFISEIGIQNHSKQTENM